MNNEQDEAEDVGDVEPDEEDFDDEGIGSERNFHARLLKSEASLVWQRAKKFCVTASGVRIRATYDQTLCMSCYIAYVDMYSSLMLDHEHFMHHTTVTADEVRVIERRVECAACLRRLTQVTIQDICLACS